MPPKINLASSLREKFHVYGLSRTDTVKALAAIYGVLPLVAAQERSNRVPGREHEFYYRYRLGTGAHARDLYFIVADAGWPDQLWVTNLFVAG